MREKGGQISHACTESFFVIFHASVKVMTHSLARKWLSEKKVSYWLNLIGF